MNVYKVYDASRPHKEASHIYASSVNCAAKKWGDEYYSRASNWLDTVSLIIVTPLNRKHKRVVSYEPATIVSKK